MWIDGIETFVLPPMTKDTTINVNEYQYLNLLQRVMDEGVECMDRTGVGTKEIFGAQMRFTNIQDNFPLLTTKKMFLKGVIHELLWFLTGKTNVKYLEENGINIWTSWKDEDGELGWIYPWQWRNLTVIKFDAPIHKQNFFSKKQIIINKLLEEKEIINTNNFGKINIINKYVKKINQKNRIFCDIQFIETGFIKNRVRYDAIIKGVVKDPYQRTVYGIGYLGEPSMDNKSIIYRNLYDTWNAMIQRCYIKSFKQYKNYGEKGIFVDESWHCFAKFLEDVQKIDGYDKKLKNLNEYELDKDFKGGNCYSYDTCVWLNSKEQAKHKSSKSLFMAISPHGSIYVDDNQKDFAKNHNLSQQNISKCLSNKYKQINGWRFEKIETNGFIGRIEKFDQIANVIKEIKNNPTSRRLIVSVYNSAYLKESSLPPCHSFFQFNVQNGKLNCHLYQRSADMFLGAPFNIASYSLLTMMIAQVCELQAGDFIHTIGSAHIYSNHFDQVNEQLSRVPFDSPKIVLNKDIKDIDKFKFNDFELIDYKSHPSIKAPVAV